MNRRQFLATSPLFLAALALGAKKAGALPIGFPEDLGPFNGWYLFEFPDDKENFWGFSSLVDGFNGWKAKRITLERYHELGGLDIPR